MDTIKLLNKPGLAHRCRKEQRLYRRRLPNDPRYCYELFRMALQNNDLEAWDLAINIFGKMVTSWVNTHKGFHSCGENVEAVVQGAFDRCFNALSRGGLDESVGLGGLINYLKICVNHEIIDLLRKKIRPTIPLPDDVPGDFPRQTDPIAKEKLWNFVNHKLKDKRERIVVYAYCFLYYPPKQIYENYKSNFKSVKDVSRVWENVVARLRRDKEFKEYFDFDYDA